MKWGLFGDGLECANDVFGSKLISLQKILGRGSGWNAFVTLIFIVIYLSSVVRVLLSPKDCGSSRQ